MSEITRRELLALGGMGVSAALLESVRALAETVKPVRIQEIDSFKLDIPVSKEELAISETIGYDPNDWHRSARGVAKVVTDAGVTGYSFYAAFPPEALPQIRQVLVGKDLFAIEQHLSQGLNRWGGVEHAIWDAIGKIAHQPVYKLLGGTKNSIKPYLTCVWKRPLTEVPYKEQAEAALKYKNAGFKGMKVQAWRPNPSDDAEACREMRAAVGPDFAIMFDRTARQPETIGQKVWDYETGLKMALALRKYNATWLEEPFARDDYESPARLAAAVDIPITGGEAYTSLEPFRQCLLHKTYSILQPDSNNAGGIFMCRKVATLAQAFQVPCILHGFMALGVAACLQVNLAIGSEWQELAHVRPPLFPQEQWAPALKLLKSKEVFIIRDGEIQAPEYPGLGLDVDEEALVKYRVAG